MKEESNCFGLIIWIQAARGYTHLLRALSGWRDAGTEGEEERRCGESGGGGGGGTNQHGSLSSHNDKRKRRRPSIRTESGTMLHRREEREGT